MRLILAAMLPALHSCFMVRPELWAGLFDIPAEWRKRCDDVTEASLQGGHFFVDQFPDEVATKLAEFLGQYVANMCRPKLMPTRLNSTRCVCLHLLFGPKKTL